MEFDMLLHLEKRVEKERGIDMRNLYEEILKMTKEEVARRYGDTHEVFENTVRKNNGLVKRAIIIRGTEPISPNVYVDEMLDEVKDGMMTKREVVEVIIRIYENNKDNHNLDIGMIANLKGSTDKIVPLLVNAEKNDKFLENVPHKRMLDLAVIYKFVMHQDVDGIASITVTNTMLEYLEMTLEELDEVALKNIKTDKQDIKTMADVLKGLLLERMGLEVEEDTPTFPDVEDNKELHEMFVLGTNSLYGATVLYTKKDIEILAEKIGANLMIMPSSIWEVIAIPVQEDVDANELRRMVVDINASQVPEDEVLSDNVYIYDRETNELKIA